MILRTRRFGARKSLSVFLHILQTHNLLHGLGTPLHANSLLVLDVHCLGFFFHFLFPIGWEGRYPKLREAYEKKVGPLFLSPHFFLGTFCLELSSPAWGEMFAGCCPQLSQFIWDKGTGAFRHPGSAREAHEVNITTTDISDITSARLFGAISTTEITFHRSTRSHGLDCRFCLARPETVAEEALVQWEIARLNLDNGEVLQSCNTSIERMADLELLK